MLNLIKPEQKKKIISEYRWRFVVVALSLVFFAQIIAIVLLVPSFITAHTRRQILNSQTTLLKVQSVTDEVSALNKELKKTNDYIKILTSSSTPMGASSVLEEVINQRDVNKLKINGLFYRVQNGKQQVNVQGVASARQDLLDFTKKLKQQPGVVSVDLPVSDFASAQNINFSITVLVNPQPI